MFLRTRAFSFFTGIVLAGFLAACTAGVPTIENMGSLGGFGVDQTSVSGKNFRLTGVCSSQFTSIEISQDGGSTWVLAETLSSNFQMNCSAGNFGGDMQFASMLPSFLVRGRGSLGVTSSSVVAMQAAVPQRAQSLSAAAGRQSNGSYKLSGSLTHDDRLTVMSNGSFKIKGTLVGQ